MDTRVIAATHRDLKKMVSEGTFREDLFYRLDVIAVPIPSLRERREDIPLLVEFFLRMFAARYGRDARALSREAMNGLMAQSWPGNVRQLENMLLNAWILSDGDELAVDDFELLAAAVTTPQQASVSAPVSSAIDHEQRDKAQIIAALEKTGWNRAQAAKDLGIPRRTFYRRLKRYGIQ